MAVCIRDKGVLDEWARGPMGHLLDYWDFGIMGHRNNAMSTRTVARQLETTGSLLGVIYTGDAGDIYPALFEMTEFITNLYHG